MTRKYWKLILGMEIDIMVDMKRLGSVHGHDSGRKVLLGLKDVEAWYDKLQVLKGVDMRVYPGEIVAIIGPNGCGKSTTFKCITGLIQKKTGKIFFDGRFISRKKPHEITKLGISIVPQGRRVFSNMTVEENLEMGGFILDKGVMRNRIKDIYRFIPELKGWRNKKATFLSGGQQQLLSIGRALMLKPRLLLMDEPSLGLSPIALKGVFKKILEINEMGTTIMIVEQNAKAALKIADRAYVLELGKNKLEGTGKELLEDPRVSKLYLGGH
jgi:branched-chain amino acid transport system ATP-binding protein